MPPIIRVADLSKSYIINHERKEKYTALRDVISEKVKRLFSFPKSMRPNKGTQEKFFALKYINFKVEKGDRLGIIGRNGAGKSTLLKILSRITEPTKGRIELNGRVASLLEVGTGFHPELTGRENIFLNGAILGMTRIEIKRKFEEIVDFAEVERFLDTPVKRYSSGMYVRLAFAVAANLEPEILIVDEVLAVGDVQFQKKCLGKMEDVSKGEGRTVIFVSHNMAALQSLCTKAILLTNGILSKYGAVNDIIEEYLLKNNSVNLNWNGIHAKNNFIDIKSARLTTKNNFLDIFINDEIELILEVEFKTNLQGIAFEIFLQTLDGVTVACSFTELLKYSKGHHTLKCIIPPNILNSISYTLTLGVSKDYNYFIVRIEDIIIFEIQNISDEKKWFGNHPGVMRPNFKWIT